MDNRSVEEVIRQRMADLATLEHWEKAYQYAMQLTKERTEAMDLVQDAYEQTQMHLQANPETEIKHPDSWLRKIVKNRFLNSKRGKLRNTTTSLDLLHIQRTTEDDLSPFELPASSNDEPEYVLEAKEEDHAQKNLKRGAIIALALDHEVEKVALLRIVEGLPYQEIELICRIPLARVKQHVKRCLHELARVQEEQ